MNTMRGDQKHHAINSLLLLSVLVLIIRLLMWLVDALTMRHKRGSKTPCNKLRPAAAVGVVAHPAADAAGECSQNKAKAFRCQGLPSMMLLLELLLLVQLLLRYQGLPSLMEQYLQVLAGEPIVETTGRASMLACV